MKKLKNLLSAGNSVSNRQATKGGSYSLAMTAVVLAILVVVNIFVSVLPTSLTKYDISSSQLYSITSNTKVVVNALEKDVTIYWIVQSGEEDQVIENLLNKYESLSDHIAVTKKNPDVYPTFTQQYAKETVQNNSLIVECGEKYRYIALTDIYIGEVNIYSGTYNADSFDGEGAITSAIDYVTSDEYPQVYLLEGHGEETLPTSFAEQIEKENMETQTLSLMTTGEVPEDADCVLIHAPQSDLSEEEADILLNYVADGGKLMVAAGATEDGILENLYNILGAYGVTANEGIVVEGNSSHYLSYSMNGPVALIPEMKSSSLTDPLLEDNYSVIMPISIGLTADSYSSRGSVTELLTTSYDSYSKTAGYALTTYEYEEGDIDGPFAVAVSVEDYGGGEIVWFSSDRFLNDGYNAFSSGANLDLAMNALSSLVGETEAMAIRTKSLNYNYLTISDSVSSLLKVVMVGVFPLTYLGIGIIAVLKRKKVQNETV